MRPFGTGSFFTQNDSVESHPGGCVHRYVSLFIAERSFTSGTNRSLFSHSPIEGCLSPSQHLAVMDKAAMNVRTQVRCEDELSLAHLTEEETDAQRGEWLARSYSAGQGEAWYLNLILALQRVHFASKQCVGVIRLVEYEMIVRGSSKKHWKKNTESHPFLQAFLPVVLILSRRPSDVFWNALEVPSGSSVSRSDLLVRTGFTRDLRKSFCVYYSCGYNCLLFLASETVFHLQYRSKKIF